MSRRTKWVLHRYYCRTGGSEIIIFSFLTRSVPCPIHKLPNMNVMRNEVRFTCPCSTIHVYAPGFNIALWISKWSEVWAVGLCLYGNHDQWYRFSMQSEVTTFFGSEKRGCGSNDEGNHFIPIPPAQIFLTREITELQRFLSEDDEELLTSEILNSLAHEERQTTWKSIGMSRYAGLTE